MPRLYFYLTTEQLGEINAISEEIVGNAFGARAAILRKIIYTGIKAYKAHRKEGGKFGGMTEQEMSDRMQEIIGEEANGETHRVEDTPR